jgi:hypothetical protein
MKKLKSFFLAFIMVIVINLVPFCNVINDSNIIVAEAHSGRTDSRGGHKDNKNKSGLGSYHYHCGGYSPHLHDNGVCPYKSGNKNQSSNKTSQNSKNKSNKTSSGSTSSKNTSSKDTSNKDNSSKTSVNSEKEIIKQVQLALNKLGYDCGKADGIIGKKTTEAVKKFQKDNKLTVDGIIGKEVKKALNIK